MHGLLDKVAIINSHNSNKSSNNNDFQGLKNVKPIYIFR
jgi:hypothetical protein